MADGGGGDPKLKGTAANINPIIKECRKIPNSNIINLFSIIF